MQLSRMRDGGIERRRTRLPSVLAGAMSVWPEERRSRGMRFVAVLAVVACAGTNAPAIGADARGATSRRPDLQHVLDSLVAGPNRIAPGVTAYVSGPQGTWIGSAGIANLKTREPMRPDARMRLESVSKLWIATLILQLAQEHRLGIDDAVARWLPGLLSGANRITLRQLLNHTAGLIDTNDIGRDPGRYLKAVKDRALRARLTALRRRVAKNPGLEFPSRVWVQFAAALPPLYPPGTTYHYSNIGYMVAGLVAERVSGQSLAELARQRLIGPLHLTTAAYDPHSMITGAHARGYSVAADGTLTDATTWTTGLGANGGIVSDAADEGRFLQALMRGRLLRPSQLAALKTPSAFSNYGLGTGIDTSKCTGTAYGHNGAGAGFASSVYASGRGDRVAVLLLNGHTADGHGDVIANVAAVQLYCAA